MKIFKSIKGFILKLAAGIVLLVVHNPSAGADTPEIPGLIPVPVRVSVSEGVFKLGPATAVRYGDMGIRELADYFYEATGRLSAKPGPAAVPVCTNSIELAVREMEDIPAEGYTIEVTTDSILITGADRAGLFYGIQTLRQLITPDNILLGGSLVEIPCLTIMDYPRFGYRGFMLDVARTFTGFGDVLKLLDQMAFHKLNRFHWHFTDDEGWRLPLESHPRLAAEGGYRGAGSPVHNIYGAWGVRYGGHYTRDEVKKVIEYAMFRNIEVIPELDLPGHSRTVARIYPEILCRGPVDLDVSAGYDTRKVWCAAREENYDLIAAILDEICDLFPGALIHTGGDEVPPEQWESCPDCRALMEREGMKDTRELNTWFLNRVGRMVAARGRRQAVWNEAIDGGRVEGDPVIWAWENERSAGKAVAAGYGIVDMTSQYYYFDMKQSAAEVGLAWAGIVDLAKTYNYEPAPDAAAARQVIGVEGGFWTETLLWNGDWWREYQIYPRLCALAETAWSPPDRRDFAGFKARLTRWHLERLASMNIAYRGRDGIRQAYTVPAERMKPSYRVTGSIPCTSRNPYSHAADHDTGTFARTVRTAAAGDWFEFRFVNPVLCGSITVRSGYSALPRFVIGPALWEVSYNGVDWETVDENFGYTGTFSPRAPVHKIRLTVTGEGNGEDAVIIQDLVIMK